MIPAAILAAGLYPLRASVLSDFNLGARAAGLGGAFVAKADDASALFSNPAGLAFLKNIRVKADLSFSTGPLTASRPATGSVAKSGPSQFRGTVALSWRFIKRAALGIGLHAPYNLETQWPNHWDGNGLCLSSSLSAVCVRPTISVELLRGLSLGLGLDLVSAKVGWSHAFPLPFSFPAPQGSLVESVQDLSGSGTGFEFGFLWKAHPLIQVGLTYKNQVPINFKGENVFQASETVGLDVPSPEGGIIRYRDLLYTFYKNQSVRTRLTLPKKIVFGLMSSPTPRLSVLADLEWTGWSALGSWEFQSVNDDQHLSPDFNSVYQAFYGVSPNYGLQSANLVLKNTWAIKGGVEYRPKEHFAVRGGFAHAEASTNTAHLNPVNPDLGQSAISLGFGYEGPLYAMGEERQISELSLDAFVRYAFFDAQTSSLPGYELAYKGNRWTIGVAVGFNF
jgi:long-chain fatty acid transport protein